MHQQLAKYLSERVTDWAIFNPGHAGDRIERAVTHTLFGTTPEEVAKRNKTKRIGPYLANPSWRHLNGAAKKYKMDARWLEHALRHATGCLQFDFLAKRRVESYDAISSALTHPKAQAFVVRRKAAPRAATHEVGMVAARCLEDLHDAVADKGAVSEFECVPSWGKARVFFRAQKCARKVHASGRHLTQTDAYSAQSILRQVTALDEGGYAWFDMAWIEQVGLVASTQQLRRASEQWRQRTYRQPHARADRLLGDV